MMSEKERRTRETAARSLSEWREERDRAFVPGRYCWVDGCDAKDGAVREYRPMGNVVAWSCADHWPKVVS